MTELAPYDLSPTEAAAIIGAHPDTVKRWAIDGKLPAFRTPGGWWRFRRTDLEAFLNANRREPDPDDLAPVAAGDPLPIAAVGSSEGSNQ